MNLIAHMLNRCWMGRPSGQAISCSTITRENASFVHVVFSFVVVNVSAFLNCIDGIVIHDKEKIYRFKKKSTTGSKKKQFSSIHTQLFKPKHIQHYNYTVLLTDKITYIVVCLIRFNPVFCFLL